MPVQCTSYQFKYLFISSNIYKSKHFIPEIGIALKSISSLITPEVWTFPPEDKKNRYVTAIMDVFKVKSNLTFPTKNQNF